MKLVLTLLLLAPLSVYATPAALLDEIRAHELANDVTIGLTAIHLPSGETVQLNGDKPFPMASTYKVPMAAYAFHLVAQEQLALDQMIPVFLEDHVSSSRLAEAFPHPGLEVSLLNLIEPMLIYSGELLNETHQAYLKEIMLRCRTGTNRLSGRLPPQILPIAHKTGTLGGTANDVGVMDLGERGEVVIVVFTQKSHGWSSSDRVGSERAIAETARSVYDYFRFR